MKCLKPLVCTVLLSILTASAVQADRLYVSVAASMTDAFAEIIEAFTEKHPDTAMLPNFASSGSLAKQIAQGAPADLYISANEKWMAYLIDNNLIADATSRIFAYNALVFVGSPALKVSEIQDIVSLGKIGIGTPQSVPAGQYAKQAMEKAGVYGRLTKEHRLVFAKDVRQALIYADRGEVDGSFVYRTDALLAKRAKILFTVPAGLYDRVSYPLALTASGEGKEEANAFYAFMATERVREILKKHGFETAD